MPAGDPPAAPHPAELPHHTNSKGQRPADMPAQGKAAPRADAALGLPVEKKPKP